MSSAIKQVPKMPNHQCIMEETEKESRFTNCDIFAYVKDGKFPADYTKATVNEIHVSDQGITLQVMRAGGIHYSL